MGSQKESTPLNLQDEYRAMQRRQLDCIRRGSSELGPSVLVTDTSIYTSPERHIAEQARVFRRTPLLVGLSRDLPEPGSSLVFEDWGPPIIILRCADGSLAAFHNRCPHRGGRLQAASGSRDGLVCPFHGWRFDSDGQLAHQPLEEAFNGHADTALSPVAVAERHGLIFIQHEVDHEELDLQTFLEPIDPLLAAFGLEGAEPVGLATEEVTANWKLVVDVSCEGYHVPATHPQTLSPQLVPFLTIHDHFGRHHRFASPGRELQKAVDLEEEHWPDNGYSAVHYLYPNTILTVSAAIDGSLPVIAINRSFPASDAGSTRTLYSSYRPAESPPVDSEAYLALHQAIVDINREEDLPTVAGAWRNYASLPEPAPLVFGRNEMLLQRYHHDIAEACGLPLPITNPGLPEQIP